MGILAYFLVLIAAVVLVLVVVVLARTLAFKPPKAANVPPLQVDEVPPDQLERLSKAISIPTIAGQSYADTNFAPFDEYNDFIKKAFPLFHQNTTLTTINTYALTYVWKGTDASLPPMMLTAHYDVVPVEPGTEDEWTWPGFSGKVDDGRIWGRGTLDIKSQMIAHMEAAEALMRAGFTPKRDFYFVYGQDEEVGGANGASLVAEQFEKQGLRFEGVLDEGGFAVKDVIKGVKAPLALIGIAEKGMANYELTLPGEGGHSSMPPKHTALGNVAALLNAIENNPLPTRLTPPAEQMLRNIAGEMGFVVRMAVANLWLFKGLLLKVLTGAPATNALARTTFAATMAKASNAANVLPQRATATVNVRLLPGDTLDDVANHFRTLAGTDKLDIKLPVGENASKVSPTTGRTWEKLVGQINKMYPNVIASPYLVMGGTDARKYYTVCDNVYRFTPILVSNQEKDSVHSTNESITIENYGRMIRFYEAFIKEYDD